MTDDPAGKRKRKKISLFESSMKTVGITKAGGLSMGFAIALLVLLSNLMTEVTAVEVLLIVVSLLVLIFAFAVLLQEVEHPGFESWGVIALFLIGAAFGILAYHWKAGIAELGSNAGTVIGSHWSRFTSLGGLSETVFAALFVFGILIGVLVVRIWNKEESDFVKSVSASFGGAIIPPILGKTIDVDSGQAFAAYFLGFAMSAVVNVVYCAKLIGNYTNRRSPESRTRLDFMYGKDKAEAVDKYFLKNFLENKDTVRLLLTQTLKAYDEEVRKGFASRMNSRRKIEAMEPPLASPPVASGPPVPSDKNRPEPKVGMFRRRYYYEMLSVISKSNQGSPPTDDQLEIEFRPIKDEEELNAEMFRMGITVKWLDNLEYVVAPGTYKKTLPYKDSVAGLALRERKVIVMSRDQNKIFRGSETPKSKEQKRGFKETNYISYISIPVVSDLGYQEETELGIINVDTMLFATECKLEQKAMLVKENRWKLDIAAEALREYGSNLYDDPDKNVEYLEHVTSVIRPVLRLFLICRQGSV
jgi:hypothetical protein